MVSAINPALPITGTPTTQSVRDNFRIAHDEISALQAAGPFLPIAGGEITGALLVDGVATFGSNVLIGNTVNTGSYSLDVRAMGPLGPCVRFQVPGSGAQNVQINANAALPPSLSNTLLTLIGLDASSNRLIMETSGSNSTIGLRRVNGTIAAPAATSGVIGVISWFGYDGAAYSASNAAITGAAAAAWSPTGRPTYISFSTTPTTTTAQAEAMRVSPGGNLLLGTVTDGAIKLDVVGTARVSSGLSCFGVAPPITRPAFAGAKGGNTALASVIAILVAAGFATDTTTA